MRKVIHIDMDCFYAAIEMRDDPSLRGKPVAVGGDPGRRGVLSTCNYEARKYGLHSAMPTAFALRQCPDLVLLPGDMAKYREVSEQIHTIFADYSDQTQRIALDEAYLDVTDSPHCYGSATWIAEAIRERIYRELQLTASAGAAPNKLLAKIASEMNKPNGQYVIPPEHVDEVMTTLPVKKLMGVGAVTHKKLQSMNIHTCGDMQQYSLLELTEHFGKFGERLYHACRGEDDSPVKERDCKKSVSVEHTYPHNLTTVDECLEAIPDLMSRLKKRLAREEQSIAKQYIKMKFDDFTQTTVESCASSLTQSVYQSLMATGFERTNKPVRLLGIGVRFAEESSQLSLLG